MTLAEIKKLMGVLTPEEAGPIPTLERRPPHRERPHEFMEIGEAFDTPIEFWNHTSAANAQEGKRLGRKFTARSNYPQQGTVRTWRVS